MDYYISIDGGGTKIQAILFSGDLELISSATATSANAVSLGKEAIQNNLRNCFDLLFKNTNVTTVKKVYSCILCPAPYYLEVLEDYVEVLDYKGYPEGISGLYAGGVTDSGIVVISGTGSHVSYIRNRNLEDVVGGWGAMVSDEGSGYYAGRMGLEAAIHDYENRGDHTLITQLVADTVPEHDFKKAIFSIYDSNFSSQIMQVAAFSRLVSAAAEQGDAVALGIINKNAYLLAMQTATMIEAHPDASQMPIIIAGGNFNAFQMFQLFQKYVRQQYPNADIRKPLYDPVIFGVITYILENHISYTEELKNKIKINFTKFYKEDYLC